MTDLIRNTDAAPTGRPTPMRPFTRLLVVAVAVGLIGLGIDLVHGPQAHAFPTPAVQGPAPTSLAVDHSVVSKLADEAALEPGSSVAAYSSSTADAPDEAPALAVKTVLDSDAQASGASVAAYGN
jgi:hypothetical protein